MKKMQKMNKNEKMTKMEKNDEERKMKKIDSHAKSSTISMILFSELVSFHMKINNPFWEVNVFPTKIDEQKSLS